MVKIKINIKSSQTPIETQKLTFLNVSQLHSTSDNIKKVIPYEEEEDFLSENPEPQEKIIIKPKISVGSKIKINIKKNNIIDEEEEFDDYMDDDEDELPSIEPIVVLKPAPPIQQTFVKINVKKKTETPVEYKSQILNQKPIKNGSHEPIILPSHIELVTFEEDGQVYFIHWGTGYIFPPDTHQANDIPPEPIGKLVDSQWDPSDFTEDKYPLMKRKIEWFYHYELDIDSIN